MPMVDKVQETIWIIDDELGNRKAWMRLLSSLNTQFVEANHGLEALELLRKGAKPDLILLDLLMPKMDCLQFLAQAQSEKLELGQVIICSANHDISKAVEAMRLGAVDYIEKPVEALVLQNRVRNLLDSKRLQNQNQKLQRELLQNLRLRIPAVSSQMQNLFAQVERLAKTQTTVLLTGDAGVGKNFFAQALHELSDQFDEPFIRVECQTLQGQDAALLLQGIDFGVESENTQASILLKAQNGTILLDEVGDLPYETQSVLLQILENRAVQAFGSGRSTPIRARFVATTRRDLLADVRMHRFREDLYSRLGIVQLRIPSLRERREDIPPLVQFYLQKMEQEFGKKEFTISLLDRLLKASWTGNVRQLEAITRKILESVPREQEVVDVKVLYNQDIDLLIPDSAEQELPSSILTMRDTERLAIVRALEYTRGNRRQTAEILDIGEATLYRKIKEFNLT